MTPAPDAFQLAVVIPLHNRRDLVLETLASVRAQTMAPWQVVVVDDGSSDGSADAAEAWLAAHPMSCPARVVRQANAGVSAARNRGAAEAAGASHLAFLDSDDLWPADFVERAARTFAGNAALVAASADYADVVHDASGTPVSRVPRPWSAAGARATGAIMAGVFPHPCATVFNADAFRGAGRYPEGLNYGEDLVAALMVSTKGPWGKVDAGPVSVRRFAAADARHGGHLSLGISPDVLLRQAQVLEQAAAAQGCLDVVAPLVARRWRRAGKAMKDAGRRADARACYARALANNAWDLKARWKKWTI